MAYIRNHIMRYASVCHFYLAKQLCWRSMRTFVGTVAFLLCSGVVQAQDEVDYAVHANIIYHFTKYIDWPATKKTGDFIIGVTGDSPLYDELLKLVKNKKVGNQDIAVKKFSSSAATFNCHILFISDEVSGKIKKILNLTGNTPLLLVSESEGMAEVGSCINFTIVKEKLKLEINKANIENRGLNIASELLKLGTIVR